MQDIYANIAQQQESMSKTQKKIATYILQNRAQISFYNIKELAAAAVVSEASVIRFGNFLGYSGYAELQKEFKNNARQQLTAKDRWGLSKQLYQEKPISEAFSEELHHLENTTNQLLQESFVQVVQQLASAQRIFIVCGRSAYALGVFLSYYLNIVRDNIYLIERFDSNENLLASLGETDLVFAMTFERYTKSTIEVSKYAKGKGAQIAAITDYLTSPIVPYCDAYLLAETKMSTYLDSFVSPLALINTLLAYLGKEMETDMEHRLQEFETICAEMDAYI